MYQHKLPRHPHCGIALTMNVLGGKWKPCLLSALHRGVRQPSELYRAYPDAPQRVVRQQLRELLQQGFIRKVVYPAQPLQAAYFLTPAGETLLPVVEALRNWGSTHGLARPAAPAEDESDYY